MTSIRAGSLPNSSLQELPASELCSDYLAGFCRRGDKCLKVHEICAVSIAGYQPVPPLYGPTNFLSQSPRRSQSVKCAFDNEGPGELSSNGARHDNDHVDICDIRILPTMDEILCNRPPYMPQKDDHTLHRYVLGQRRLMDVNFRQLRYDSTKVIIDTCEHACQLLLASVLQSRFPNPGIPVQTPQGFQYYFYSDINFENARFHENQGIHLRISFSCPQELRSRRILSSGRLEQGMLVALIGYDQQLKEVSTTFMNVDLCQSTDAMKSITGDHSRGLQFLTFSYTGL